MIRFDAAGPADDACLRALLRENAMPSWVSMSMEREPSFFADAGAFGREWTVVAREDGAPVGMYSCCDQRVHLNGRPADIGYLGSLRVARAQRNRIRILREGFRSVRTLSASPCWYTSVSTDNRTARRVLEAGLPGMPRYRRVNDLVTLALPASRAHPRGLWRAAAPERMETLCGFHRERASAFQFSPVLDAEAAARTGASFHMAEEGGRIVACMALWDRRAARQVVARGYRQPLAALRPAYNAFARLTRRVPLPATGCALDQASLAFLAVAPSHEALLEDLVADALALCPATVMSFGLHAAHPWLARLVRRFRPLTYRTGIYLVGFDDMPALDGRPAQPEVAVL